MKSIHFLKGTKSEYLKLAASSFLVLVLASSANSTYAQTDPVYKYENVDIMPDYPGGPDSLKAFLDKNLKNPIKVKKSFTLKKVIIQFVVEKDGTLSDKTIIKSQTAGANREAYRLVGLMPKWKPGEAGGKVVRVMSVVSIPFLLP